VPHFEIGIFAVAGGYRVDVTGRFFIRHMNAAGASGASLSC
jgi:hypothetical protein